ncbi:MAG: glycosyl hydrolase family 28-related protein, partial [Planctomycetota bacterium]
MPQSASRIRGLFAVAETLESRRLLSGQSITFPADSGVIDVTDPFLGVVPDDGLDDTAAIQRVFDLVSPGRVLYFPDGQYDLSGQTLLQKSAFTAEAESLDYTGWSLQTEGERTFLEAVDVGTGPDDAGRITFNFDAIEASRVLTLTHRFTDGNDNSFYYRINGGDWRANSRPVGNTDWRSGVVATGIPLETGSNTLEIAVREAGFQIDNIGVAYLGNYLNNIQIQGQSEAGTVFKLADGATNDDGTPFDGALIKWENGVEQFFRTAVRDVTFDVGDNNPEADALKFHGNNQSVVANVTMIAGEGSGDVGLDLAHTAAIGPIMVRDLTVEGFNIGVHSGWQNASRTMENITVRNQREYGVVNEAAAQLFVRNLRSENSVPAFRNNSVRLPGDGQGKVILLDSVFLGLPGAESTYAINTLGDMYVRNVRTSGYDIALANFNQQSFRGYRGQDGIDGDYIGEWWTRGQNGGDRGGFSNAFESPDTMLRLPIREEPVV